jgi:uncharacterized protein YecT (DUF1311 family)
MKTAIAFLLILFTINGFSQTSEEHIIDKELRCCLDSSQNYTTAGMSGCVIKATEEWDKELNKNYQKLLLLLTDEQKIMLKESQRKWIEFRDKEIQFSNDLYSSLGGTMWVPVMYETRMNLTRERALEIQTYIDNLTIKEGDN